MRAVVRERYEARPRVADVARPQAGPGELLVRVVASSLNTADGEVAAGTPRAARIANGIRAPRSPRLGLDVAGVVEAVGEGVDGFSPGDEVFGDVFGNYGAFAEMVSAPAKVFALKPAGVTFQDAAAVPHSGILALQGLTAKGGVKPGDRVLINGAGGCVGPLAIQIAKAMGAHVTGVDHSGKLDLMRRAGADVTVDYTTTNCTRMGVRFDFVLDIASRPNLFAFRKILGEHGRYVRIARGLGGFAAAAFLGGSRMGNVPWAPSRRSDLDTLGRHLEAGTVKPIIDHTCTLEDVPAELEAMASGAHRGKVIVQI